MKTTRDGESPTWWNSFLVIAVSAPVTASMCGLLLAPLIRCFFPLMSPIEGMLLGTVSGDTVLSYLSFSLSYSWDLLWALLGASIVLSYAQAHFAKFVSTTAIALTTALVVIFVTGSQILIVKGDDASMQTLAVLLGGASGLLSFVATFVVVRRLGGFRQSRSIPRSIVQGSARLSEDNPYQSPSSTESGLPEERRQVISRSVSARHVVALVSMFASGLVAMSISTEITRFDFRWAESLARLLFFPGMVAGIVVGVLAASLFEKILSVCGSNDLRHGRMYMF